MFTPFDFHVLHQNVAGVEEDLFGGRIGDGFEFMRYSACQFLF